MKNALSSGIGSGMSFSRFNSDNRKGLRRVSTKTSRKLQKDLEIPHSTCCIVKYSIKIGTSLAK